MLARDRFQTETPNVIDPGEGAPSCPNRRRLFEDDKGGEEGNISSSISSSSSNNANSKSSRGSLIGSNENENNNTNSNKSNNECGPRLYTRNGNKGTISKGIRIRCVLDDYSIDDDDDDYDDDDNDDVVVFDNHERERPFHDEDNQNGNEGNKFVIDNSDDDDDDENENGIAQARLFAAAMLSESDKRNSKRNIMGGSNNSGRNHNHNHNDFLQESSSTLRQMMKRASSFRNNINPNPNDNNDHRGSSSNSNSNSRMMKLSRASSFRNRPNNNHYIIDEHKIDENKHLDNIWLVDDTPPDNVVKSSSYYTDLLRKNLVRVAIWLVFGIVVTGFAVAIGLSRSSRSSSSSSSINNNDINSKMNTNISTAVTISNDERLEAIVTFLSETTDISSAKDLYDATSPQFKAAKWLADDDSERLVVPSFSILSDTSTTSIETGLATATTSSPFNFVQRYVLVVLYFALGGDDNNGNDNDNDNDNGSHDDNAGDNRAGGWTDDYFFVSEDRHECSWYERVLLRTNENKNSNNNGSSHGKGDDCDDGDDGDDGDGGDNSNDDSDGHYYAMGVTCDRDLQVRNISLPSNNLKGTIPSEIQYLSKLDYLDLKHNGLSGSIPLALEELGQLSHLDLSDNELTGIMIPYWLGEKLMNLEFLNLSNNHLLMITDASSGVPNSLGGGGGGGDDSSNGSGRRHLGETLQTLALGGNNDYGGVTGTGTISIPEEIRYLTNLRELSLNNMNFGGTIPAWLFTDLKELRFLDLSHNQFTGSIGGGGGGGGSDHSSSSSSNGDHGLHSLQHLKSLVLHDNALTGTLSESIGLFQELSTLTLHHTNVTVGTEAANFICWRESLESLTTDCGDVTCPCCIEECCDSEDCFQDVDWDTDASFSTSTHNPI